jgi:uncharacterized integral membrane protein
MVRAIMIVLVATVFLLLSVANWSLVPFNLPDGNSVQVPLPLIIAAAFLVGWLPTWLSGLASRTMMKHKLERAERLLTEAKARTTAPVTSDANLPGTTLPGTAE